MEPEEPPFDPDDTAALSDRLASRLADGLAGVVMTEPLARIGSGLDTYIYAFRLGGDLPPQWLRPLVLRAYTLPSHAPKARREHDIQLFLAELGFPAPEPLLVEETSATLGRPFMVMERMPGVPLLHRMRNPLAIGRVVRRMASLQARLHRLSSDRCPLQREPPLIDRHLSELADAIERFGLTALQSPLAWLRRHAGRAADGELSILHMDFHPLNILIDASGALSVLDWSDAAIGDPHADVARTIEVFHAAPDLVDGLERILLRALRPYILRTYLQAYARKLPLDSERLRYWQAVAVARGIAQAMIATSPQAVEAGSRADIALSDRLLPALEARLAQLTH